MGAAGDANSRSLRQHGDTIRIGGTTLYFILGDDLPVTGQPIDVSRNA